MVFDNLLKKEVLIRANVSEELNNEIDLLMTNLCMTSKSEFIRIALKEKIERWKNKETDLSKNVDLLDTLTEMNITIKDIKENMAKSAK